MDLQHRKDSSFLVMEKQMFKKYFCLDLSTIYTIIGKNKEQDHGTRKNVKNQAIQDSIIQG
jgi:hypothetical protein